jgi:hypothetical protein
MTGVQLGGGPTFDELVAEWAELAAEDGGVEPTAGRAWLARALRVAARLEFSTIPPYLCALWSLEDQSSPTATTIRHVVQEEMLHMSLACNMLVSLGDGHTPDIADPSFVPTYPGGLSGGVHEGLVVALAGFSHDNLRVFLEIELPSMNLEHATEALHNAELYEPRPVPGEDVTIGEFYEQILNAFETLRPDFELDRQITGPLSWVPISSVDDVERAIRLITDQGEGAAHGGGPTEEGYVPGEPVELSHFYRFLELALERRIVPMDRAGTTWGFGEPIEHPAAYPMAPVPAGGYSGPDSDAPDEVVALCREFNAAYTRLLRHLDAAWAAGDQGELVRGIEVMFSLAGPARRLMTIPKPDGSGTTYGPDFLLLDDLDG